MDRVHIINIYHIKLYKMKKTETITPNKGVPTKKSDSTTRDEIHARARQLALDRGRVPPNISHDDYEQAKIELENESAQGRKEVMLNAIPDVLPKDPVSSSIGYQLPEPPNEDEDDEGRSLSEQLAEKGVEKAEQDQVLQAALETEKTNKGEPRI